MSDPRSQHLDTLARMNSVRDVLHQRWNRLANLRLLAFAIALALGIVALTRGSWLVAGLAAIGFMVFAIVAARHGQVGRARRDAGIRVDLAADRIARIDRNWTAIRERPFPQPDADHQYAGDLDIVGTGSLLHLLDTTETTFGHATLGSWLLEPADPATIVARQAAVRDLAAHPELLAEIALQGRLAAEHRTNTDAFLEWVEATPWLPSNAWALWSARVLTALIALGFVSLMLDLIVAWQWVLLLVIAGLVHQFTKPAVVSRLHGAASTPKGLLVFADLLTTLDEASFSAPLLVGLQFRLRTADGHHAPESLHTLARLSRWWIPSGSMAHFPLQLVTLWDIHLLNRFERWQGQAGLRARDWLTVAGEFEALAALATFAHDHPDFAYPSVSADHETVAGSALGHPLIPDDRRVANDAALAPRGKTLLVTGSNMSGKSTLLRAVGINVVLAQAGAPVCATRFEMPPVTLWTSMRVRDSLNEGVSYFMAELLRLKSVVVATRTASQDGQAVCYLLDEILHGTNTAERQIAARRIVRELVDLGAIGAVSTHDLTLAEGSELAGVVVPVHFTETFTRTPDGPVMTFDYRLRPGIATSTNALALMEVIGLFPAEPVR